MSQFSQPNARSNPRPGSVLPGFLRSAKAASGGTKRKRNSADLATGNESVLREFLKSAKAAKARCQIEEEHANPGLRSESVLASSSKVRGFYWSGTLFNISQYKPSSAIERAKSSNSTGLTM